MPDRLMVITQLGALVEDAAQRGDDRAADVLRDAIELIVDGAVLDRRRRVDRNRKRLKHSAESAESVESADVRIRPLGFSPTPPFPTPPDSTTPPPRARESDADAQLTEGLIILVSQSMGALWVDADAFIRRRGYSTWKGWLKEMQTLMVGGQAMPADVAQVCRDDAALAVPVGSPKGFRAFVASSVRERLAAVRNDVSAPKATPGSGRAALLVGEIRALIQSSQQPGQAANRFIRRADVQAKGVTVFRAYEAVGGADRFINSTGEQTGFLIRDFAAALSEQDAA